MRIFWLLLAVGLSLPATSGAFQGVDAGRTIQAKHAVVAAALAVREARFDWEAAEALVHQAEAGVEAARIEAQQAEERGASAKSTAQAFAVAQRNWTRALGTLQATTTRLGRAEQRLEDAEALLDQVDPRPESATR